MVNLKEKSLIFCVLLLALCMRVHFMTRSLFYDELYTAVYGVQAPSLFEALFKNFNPSNHIGYTAIAYLTCHIIGIKEWTLRLPALLFGLGSIFIFWLWSRKYFGPAVAILGALFLALAPAHIIWSASARGYTACIFFSILSTALYFSLLEKPSLRTTWILTVTNTLASSFHVYFLCIFFAQLVHFLALSIRSYARHDPLIKKESLFFVLLSNGMTCLFSALIYVHTIPGITSMALDHRDLVSAFPLTLFRDLVSLPLWPLGSLCLVLMLLGFIRSTKMLPHWRVYVAVLFLMIIPVWLSKPVYLYPRFFAYLLPFLFLLLANGVVGIIKNSSNKLRPYVLTTIIFAMGFIAWTWFFKPAKIVEDFHYKFREAVEFGESISSPQTRFCAFGDKDRFFQFYSQRPVVTFKTFEDFKTFYAQNNEIICFFMMGPPMPEEHKKILLFTFVLKEPKAKDFDNVIVLDLKG